MPWKKASPYWVRLRIHSSGSLQAMDLVMSDHNPSTVEDLCRVAKAAGCEIDTWDYGFSAGCRKPDGSNLLIAEVYRSERDGYTGGKIITRELLDEWLRG